MFYKWIVISIGLILATTLLPIFVPFRGVGQVAHDSTRFHLVLLGSSVYEYHALKGQWPGKNDDLGQTTLPVKSPYWKLFLEDKLAIMIWHTKLDPDPSKNADQILVYYDKGQISERGKKWVCWGDLRTEYLPTEELQRYLDKFKK